MLGVQWKKNMFWIGLVVTLLVNIVMVDTSFSAGSTRLSAPIILDTDKTPDSTLFVDVSIEEVQKLWGFEFRLYYNTTVLTATGASSYDPFTVTLAAPIINETGGYIEVAYSMPFGEQVGFSTVDPAPIVKFDFTVNALGGSWLELENVKLTEPEPKKIYCTVVDGFFANIEVELHDIAVTDLSAPSHVEVGEIVTVTVAVKNEGVFDETCNVSLYYHNTLIERQVNITLTAGADTTLTFTWNTTGVAELTYTVKAEASAVPGEYDTGNNVRTVEVTVGGEEPTAGQDFTLYIVAGVVIVVVLATLVYLLKIRKPKTP